MVATTHTILGFTSLLFGAMVLLRPKGTPYHILIGRLYIVSMVVLCLTSFGMFEMFGGFGIFHVAAIFSLFSIAAGLGAALFRRRIRGWIYWHYQFMAWSYIGLLGATSNEAFVHIGPLNAIAEANRNVPLLSLAAIFICGAIYVNVAMKSIVRSAGIRDSAQAN